MRVALVMLLAAVAGAECQRAPAEDFPARPDPPAAAASAVPPVLSDGSTNDAAPLTATEPSTPPAPAGRCVLPTPREAPPPVPPGPAAGCPADPEGGPGKLPLVRVAFPDAGGVEVVAELVRTEHDSMRGLMYRKSLGADRGMLFDLRVRDDHKFWMHNTCIPLDLMYVDEDGLIVGIVENAPTLDDTSRGVGCPSRYVLEVNAGWSRRHGVTAGQHMKLP